MRSRLRIQHPEQPPLRWDIIPEDMESACAHIPGQSQNLLHTLRIWDAAAFQGHGCICLISF